MNDKIIYIRHTWNEEKPFKTTHYNIGLPLDKHDIERYLANGYQVIGCNYGGLTNGNYKCV